MERKKVVFISGPIEGVAKYWEAFEQAEEDLDSLGYIPLSPSRLPGGLTNEQYMKICTAMIDSADAVLLLPNWDKSKGSLLERHYCEYTGKPYIKYEKISTRDPLSRIESPRLVTLAWLENDLKEVLGE